MKSAYSTKFRIHRPIIHGLMIIGIFYLFYKIRLITDLIPGIQIPIPAINYEETMIFALMAAFLFIGIGILKELYELNKPIQKYFKTFTKTWIYWFITITFFAYFGQWFIFSSWISRFVIILWWIFSFLLILLFDQIWNYIEIKRNKNSRNKIIIISHDTINSYKIIEKIKNGFPFKTEFIKPGEINEINIGEYFMAIAVGTFQKEILQEIFERIRLTNTRFYHIGEWFFLEDVIYTPENIDNIIALEYKHSKLDGRSIIFKRIMDILVSGIACIIFSPIMLIIAILIKLGSKWPILFRQKRVWAQGKLFTFIKFRTMYKHLSTGEGYGGKEAEKLYKKLIKSEANVRGWVLPKIKNDPRVTRLWRFLRRSSLDELPQLFLVFIGQMSLVGPRPHLPQEVAQYEPWQKRVLSIKPGITWYAQIFGRDELTLEEEAKLELYYIKNWSIFMDIYVILSTLRVILKGK